MTFDLALNRKDGDLVFNENSEGFATLWFINGADRIAQSIKIELQIWLGDWFLDQARGVPYLETVFLKQTRDSTRESILRSRIASVPGVRRINSLTMSNNAATRKLTVEFNCDTVEGLVSGSLTLDKVR